MKIAVDMGHTPKSTGAVGYLNELKEDRRIGYELIGILKEMGHEVLNVTPADTEEEWLTGRARRANNWGADFFVSIHLNAGGGTGTEVFTTPASGAKKQASKVSANVSKVMGITNRGHKTSYFTVITQTAMPAILVEVCFVDNATDRDAYNACTPRKIAQAIAEGITGQVPVPVEPIPDSPQAEKNAKVDVDGVWGTKTTLALQQMFGLKYQDGIVSRQYVGYKAANPGLDSGWEWEEAANDGGSPLIKHMQLLLGVEADGKIGPNTIKALQKRMGTYIDGEIWRPSKAVAEMQRRINEGRF